MLSGQILAHHLKFHKLTTTNNDQLATGTDLPANGSYVDVSPYIRVHVALRFGAIDSGDAPALAPRCSDAVGGVLDVISATIAHVADPGDDYEFVIWTIEVSSLPTDHHFIAIDVTADVGTTYADAFLLGEVKTLPAVNVAGTLPAASQYYYAGGVAVAES